MDQLIQYRQIIRSALQPYVELSYANIKVRNIAAFDSQNDQYVIISEGWNHQQHLHGCLIHIEIMDGKVWIQVDGTEGGIAETLMLAGIPKNEIVLGFHEPEIRPHTRFAIA